MADKLTAEHRSWNMSRIRSTNTAPEKLVRSMLHRMGYRFSLHRKDLTGRPDIVMPKHNTVIFVHGCFWHRHKGCKDASLPKTRTEWWLNKLNGNVSRDRRNQSALRKAGWRVQTVWECETEKPEKLEQRLGRLLKIKSLTR
jgi:DNA mismatch endonuclease (patch repair protein)